MNKLDYKKEYKDFYLPKQKPMLIDVPHMQFIMIDGQGVPQGSAYQDALQALYALTFIIKMSKMGNKQIPGYVEYVVPPLEGLWWSADGALDFMQPKSSWCWTSMIRQPDFVTEEVFQWALAECSRKKPQIDTSKARFCSFTEGLCVQMLHIGSYEKESASLEQMQDFMKQNNLKNMTGKQRKHHEIYLSDPRKTAVERLKTVLRLPVAR